MTVYIPIGENGYELCQPVAANGFMSLNSAIMSGIEGAAELPPLEIIHSDQGAVLMHSDAPWLGSQALIFREPVVRALGDIFGTAKLHPVQIASDLLYLCNPPVAQGALDEEQSVVDRFSDGRIMAVKSYAFVLGAIAGLDIFRIGDFRVSPTFVSQRFVDTWRTHKFMGLEFQPVWSYGAMPSSICIPRNGI